MTIGWQTTLASDDQRKSEKVEDYKEDVIVVHIYTQEHFCISSKS
jgi:hypothetical protein